MERGPHWAPLTSRDGDRPRLAVFVSIVSGRRILIGMPLLFISYAARVGFAAALNIALFLRS
jgi:hypothetical protein